MRLRQVIFPCLMVVSILWSGVVWADPESTAPDTDTNGRVAAMGRVILPRTKPVPALDLHVRPGAGFGLKLNLYPPGGDVTLLPSGESRSLVCGIQDQGAIRVLPLCRSRFELLPQTLLFAPEGVPGLRGEYYPGITLRGRLGAVRIEPDVNFSWGTNSPATRLAATNFSGRWSGFIKLDRDGECQFTVLADGGVRLWVDGYEVINDWQSGPLRQRTGRVKMKSTRQHLLRLDYFHEQGPAEIHLGWNWGLFTTTPEDVSRTQYTPQTTEWHSPSEYSVRLISPFAEGAGLDAASLATQCQVVPAIAAVLTVTNSGAETKMVSLLCGLDQPAERIDGSNWVGMTYGEASSNTAPRLAIITEPGPAVLRELDWQAADKPHGMFVIPCEVPSHGSVRRVFWISRYQDTPANTPEAQRPYYSRCWPDRNAMLNWLATRGDAVIATTMAFDAAAIPPLKMPPDAPLQWRGWVGGLTLSASATASFFDTPFTGAATNFYESHFTPEWLRKLRDNRPAPSSPPAP
jgi:hypothetical protein